MRLTKMKLAGFKSFVDPTTIHFPSEMVGVVGPNGCGKSNIIDAVRWVMGESSRHIRGDSMDDVIFNGSHSRKPVGQASIELVFDNREGKAGGQYAGFAEIALRRQVSRDGQSRYFLNGSKCRRRDIADIFLGTGLGPRSYSIIEQGMISRLIEAKPEDLRSHLEEAAGISKYKERRRETENRLRHTRENMDRLNDLIEEVEKQLRKLQRQARTAERYKSLKDEERLLEAQLLALQWDALGAESASREQAFREQDLALERLVVTLHAVEAQGEQGRTRYAEANESFNRAQGRFYQLGSEISRVEQALQHAREVLERSEREREQGRAACAEEEKRLASALDRSRDLEARIADLEQELEAARAEAEVREEALSACDAQRSLWDERWRDLNQRIARPSEQAQVERARIEHLERQSTQLSERERSLQDELARLEIGETRERRAELERELDTLRREESRAEEQLREGAGAIQDQRAANVVSRDRLHECRTTIQNRRGRLASLEALQESALGKRQGKALEWLREQGLSDAPRLAERLDVEVGWERAVETVLGGRVEAVCVDRFDAFAARVEVAEGRELSLFDTRGGDAPGSAPEADALADKVRAPWPVGSLLSGVRIVEDLANALERRLQLADGESVVTRDGVWVGRAWIRAGGESDPHAGVLEREAEIKALTRELALADSELAGLEQEAEQGRDRLHALEAEREVRQEAFNQVHRQLSQRVAQCASLEAKEHELVLRNSKLNGEIKSLSEDRRRCVLELEEATQRRNAALEGLEDLSREKQALEHEKEGILAGWEQQRSRTREQREAVHQFALSLETTRSGYRSAEEEISRLRDDLSRRAERLTQLEREIAAAGAPLAEDESRLQGLLEQRLSAEQQLQRERDAVQTIENELRDLDGRRAALERSIDTQRETVNGLRERWQESRVRADTVAENLQHGGHEPRSLLDNLEEGASAAQWEQRVTGLRQRIDRLGPINLAAIEEFREQGERKAYLDEQHSDLSEALETLENAIRKIDRETRQRFKETFDRVSARLQETFPRLFGGGQAHLELTGNDLLTTGVSILARPPGKRLSSIHLMSGGEKALTAVALVFAIFELNPAPFCMLDEVDAPLDEANVGRFCELVKQMSKTVQFVFITHNKTTMEYAEQLVGITMHEPGVSRLVAVDVDEAAEMATG